MELRDKYRVMKLDSSQHNTYSSLKKATLMLSLMDVPGFVCRILDNKIISRNYYIMDRSDKRPISQVIFPKGFKDKK
jgi:hypothetical protein